ncbi:hypothetical protein DICPUDRAFT_149724 [Dictyostelium purpureum]|uniref:Saposin B-type domain-containing protein n=1 Tax=Dictyostelium purpureum TaxID=5786 RepID=F0ZEI1_DICPU|nr:uncharacterized protein DICPUDRAFT_149724 [Dictyostelium purpureum]EGC37651.1 hypothetical protein DICPUDRAFT_149724 [Dictyostelium purpureum]|eukprot:XP_003285839.1 hypothetical protein DICPUDRAFT_149724 [Dictyostelium purpureum]
MKLIFLLVLIISLFNNVNSLKISKNENNYSFNSVRVSSQIKCEVCSYVVNYIENVIESSRGELVITDGLEDLCSTVPKELRSICDNFVSNNVDNIIDSIINKETPDSICQDIGFCSSDDSSDVPTDAPEKPTTIESSSSSSSIDCTICEFLIERIELYVEGNSTQNQIEYYLDKDCKLFGGYAGQCQVYVNQYVPMFVNYIAHNEQPKVACSQVNLC